jgi:hypothetical protein
VFKHSNSVYLMKSGTLKSFGTTMFDTKHISAARMGSNKSFPSTSPNLSSRAENLPWFIRPVDLSSEGLSTVRSIVT